MMHKSQSLHTFMAESGRIHKGVQCVTYLSKLSTNKPDYSDLVEVNGLCKYRFILCMDMIIGIQFQTPATHTQIYPSHIVIGSPSERFDCNYNLQPQGIVILESPECSTLIMTLKAASPLLVQVDL